MISGPTTKRSTYMPTNKGRSRNWSGSDLNPLIHYTTNNCTYDCKTIRFLSDFHCEDRATGEFETIRKFCDLSNVKCYKNALRQKITIECLGTCPCLLDNGKERDLTNFYHKKERARNWSGSDLSTLNHNTTKTNKNCTKACHYISRPVCGSNGETYHNTCMLENAACINPEQSIKVDCEGKCPCKRHCSSACPQTFKPVCGSNDETYSNDCLLEIAACESPEQNITVECRKKCPCKNCPQACPAILKPVCGSNGETYPNACMLENADCSNTEQNITVECKKKCPCKNCPQGCLTEWEPVCGSNGKTYGNDCELERASCQNPFETITKQCEGQCPCSNCPRELVCRGQIGGYSDVHVCGSDGVQYRDQCHLQITACQNPKQQITMKCIGGCPCRPEPPKAIANSSK